MSLFPPVRNVHVIIRSVLVAFGIFESIYVAIPDYPWGTKLWVVLTSDPSGFLHELFYIWVFVLAGMAISLWYEWQEVLRQALQFWMTPYDGTGKRTVRRVRKVAPRDDDAHLEVQQSYVLGDSVENDRKGRPEH